MSEAIKKLVEIQKNLKAPKNQKNNFGNYNYRSAEDILEAVKPLLGGFVLLLSDEVVAIGSHNYVKATAILSNGEDEVVNVAFARESETKKGMDDSQITGSTSSYARKYAMNGLFAIDDTKDADTMDNREEKKVTKVHTSMTAGKCPIHKVDLVKGKTNYYCQECYIESKEINK